MMYSLQELLAISADRVDLIDLRTKNNAHSSHVGSTADVQLLPTPDASMLLEMRHGQEGWLLKILSLDVVSEPPLFRTVKESQQLPALGHLPEVGDSSLLASVKSSKTMHLPHLNYQNDGQEREVIIMDNDILVGA
jgi:hypothetical protein